VKAVLCKQFGPPESLVLEEVPSPKSGAGEVVVTVKAASVNFPDVLIIQNKYQVKPPLPFSPGSELAGVVKDIGAGVRNAKPGDRVIAFATYGAFAEECLVPADRVLPIPEGMDFVTAASFLLTYGTSYHALRNRVSTAPGETLLVLGAAGGVGIAAIEIGKVLGLRVIACASSDEKLAVCREHGADDAINYASEDLREGIKRTPNEGELYYSLGLLLAEEKRLADAADALGMAARLMPQRARVRYNLALALDRLSRDKEAESALLLAFQLDPRDPDIVYAAAAFYVQRKQWKRALPFAERLAEIMPNEPGPGQLLASIRRQLDGSNP